MSPPTYAGDWQGTDRWKVNWVDTNKVSDIAKDNLLTFQGDGDGTGGDDHLDKGASHWGENCRFNATYDRVVLTNTGIGQTTIVRTPGVRGNPPETPHVFATLTCRKGGPGDEVWTAVDQIPPP